jgi:tetratricopeptide (TPR) repeat protein
MNSTGRVNQPMAVSSPTRSRATAAVFVHLAPHGTRTARLRRLDDILGGAETYPRYAAELRATVDLADKATYSDATGRALMGVVAEQAHQAGWAAFDAGWHAPARRHFKDGLTAASDAGDTSLIANSLAFLAYQKVSTGQPGAAEADASCRVADSTETPRPVQALLRERAAWAHAVAGDARTAEASLELAREALGERGAPGPDWAVWVDQTELQIMTGRCWSALGNPARAIPALTDALGRYDDTHARDKALYLTWLADAHIDDDDIDQAAAVARRAVALDADIASVRPRQRVKDLVGRLDSHRAGGGRTRRRGRAAAQDVARSSQSRYAFEPPRGVNDTSGLSHGCAAIRCASRSGYRAAVVFRTTVHSSPLPNSPRCQNAVTTGPETWPPAARRVLIAEFSSSTAVSRVSAAVDTCT